MSGRPPYRIEFTRAARKGLEALPARERERLARAIDALATEPRPPGARALQRQPGLLRIRVGDYRVVYQVHDDVLTVLVVRIGHRREVYRRGYIVQRNAEVKDYAREGSSGYPRRHRIGAVR